MINDSTFVGASLAGAQTDFSKSGFTMDAAGVAEEKKGGGCVTRDALRLALFPPEAAGGGVEPALESAAEAGHVGVTQIFGHGGCRVVRQAE